MNRKFHHYVAIAAASGIILSNHFTILGTTQDVPQVASQPVKQAAIPKDKGAYAIAASPQVTYSVYLPILYARYPLQNIFGVETAPFNTSGGFEKLSDLRATWSRNNALPWAVVEPTEGARNWAALADFEQQFITANQARITPLIIVKDTPSWAQKVVGWSCGPVAPAKYGAYAKFMHDLVARYSVPPYNVKYWEIGNEPDVDPEFFPSGESGFGCMGDKNDPYYGGGAYGDALKVLYPAIKNADPAAQVLIGGLLMDNPGTKCTSNNCPARFFEGILRSGGGAAFDGVSFHGYDYYDGALGKYFNSAWGGTWNTTGPSFALKLQFLRQKLSTYGVTGKYFINSETSLICTAKASICETADFESTKAYYIPQAYAVALKEGLRANIWYDLQGGWNYGSLLNGATPLPAYTAFKVARTKLQEAVFVREFAPIAGVKAFEFTRGNVKLWVVWSLDGATHTVALAPTPNRIEDALGNVIAPANSIDVTLKPLYIEWSQ